MLINPITVRMSQHKAEEIVAALSLTIDRLRRNANQSRQADALEDACSELVYAVLKAEEARGNLA